MIVLGVKLEDRSGLRGMGRKIAQVQRESLKDVARRWHQTILARHFSPGAAGGYRYEPRTPFYKRVLKPRFGAGQGKYVDLLLKGTARRSLQNLYTLTGSKDRQTLRMKAPAYFTNPYVGTFRDPKTGKQKRITRQPNKVREVTTITANDRQDLADHFAERLVQRFHAARASAATAPRI